VDAELLSKVRGLAAKEGRQLQALVDESLADLVETGARPRAHVMAGTTRGHSASLRSRTGFAAVQRPKYRRRA
jgi:hypothetical protein